MDNQTWRGINKVDTLSASRALRRLRDAGLFIQKDRGSATWYQPTARMLGEGAGKAAGGEVAAQGGGADALSSNPGALSSNPDAQGSNPGFREDALAGLRRQALLNELPSALAARVGTLGQRRPTQEMQDLVVALCEVRAWRAEEPAALLGRNVEAVRQNYLRPLLRAGRIDMIRPDKPNDPEQAYRASATP
jgi:ATP-dependent DNA helicase RecG